MVKLGIDQIDKYLDLFKNKKVGLITNPTGVNRDFNSTIDILDKKVDLVALFSPEHGVRGDLQAGVKIDDYKDLETGCMVYSLYGKNKKPTKEMLQDIDVLTYDIQDVGARFYTYIYTMAYAMMACKEYNKTFIVFDRPNPLGGSVEGNCLDINFRSFVGYYPLPQRYGLTIGELALFFNNEFNIGCDLYVIKMENYQSSMDYDDTSLPWILPSPNIPTTLTVFNYLATCIFEGTNVSEGRGTTKPFSIFGAPWMKSNLVLKELEKYAIEGVKFRPLYFTPKFSKYENQLCKGIEIFVTDKLKYRPVSFGFIILDIIRKIHPEFSFNKPYKEGMHPMIDLLVGGNFLRKEDYDMSKHLRKIENDSLTFKLQKAKYQIYD